MLNLHSTTSEQCRLDEVRRRAYENRGPSECRSPAKAYNQLNAYFATVRGNYAQNLRKLYLLNTNYADLSCLFKILAGENTIRIWTPNISRRARNRQRYTILSQVATMEKFRAPWALTGSGKTYLIKFIEPGVVSLRVIAATVETHGEHLAFLRADGRLAALVLAENSKSGSSCWHRAL
jgi:hypothetical protein